MAFRAQWTTKDYIQAEPVDKKEPQTMSGIINYLVKFAPHLLEI